MTTSSLLLRIRRLLVLALALLAAVRRGADDEKPKAEPRGRWPPSLPDWHGARQRGKRGRLEGDQDEGELFSTDSTLALPGFQGIVEPSGGGVQLTLWGNLPAYGTMPVFESEVVLHKGESEGLDFTLRRGRVLLTMKAKGKGPASARVRVTDKIAYEVRLNDAESQVAIEMYRRWPNGTVFTTAPNRRPPHDVLAITAVKGKAYLRIRRRAAPDAVASHVPVGHAHGPGPQAEQG